MLTKIAQIKKKKQKKLLNMVVKTIIIWYQLGHDECLKFQTRHSQFYQFQKDLRSLFCHKITGVKYDQKVRSIKSPKKPMKKPYTHKVNTKPNQTKKKISTQSPPIPSKFTQSILPYSQHFDRFIKHMDRLIA